MTKIFWWLQKLALKTRQQVFILSCLLKLSVNLFMGGRGSGPPPLLKNHKIIGFHSNTGPDPLKKHNATKPGFNVGPSSAQQRNAAYFGIWILSPLIDQKKTLSKLDHLLQNFLDPRMLFTHFGFFFFRCIAYSTMELIQLAYMYLSCIHCINISWTFPVCVYFLWM